MSQPLACPRCKRALTTRERDVEACAACGGIFLRAAIARVVDTLAHAGAGAATWDASTASVAHDPAALRAPCACPVCAQPMHKHRVGLALELDACSHGTWLDAGEHARLKDALARGLSVVAVRPQAAAADRPAQPQPRSPTRTLASGDDVVVLPPDPTDRDTHATPTHADRAHASGAHESATPPDPSQDALRDAAHREADRIIALERVRDLAELHRMKNPPRRRRGRRRMGLPTHVFNEEDEAITRGLTWLMFGD